MKNHYRIVPDYYGGYEAQIKRWWFPFWVQIWREGYLCNTNCSIESAKELIEWHKKGRKQKVFYYE